MNTNRKGRATNTTLNQNYFADGKIYGFDVFKYKQNAYFSQPKCSGCGSEDLSFAKNGYCQRCQQRVEFIRRERPDVIAAVRREARV
jgi:hypothetical protein